MRLITRRSAVSPPGTCPLCLRPAQTPDAQVACAPCQQLVAWLAVRLATPGLAGSTRFVDLGVDSLEMLELVMELEDEFGVELPDEVATELHTVEQVVGYVSPRLEGLRPTALSS